MVYAYEDMQKRQVPNKLMLASGLLGFVAIGVTGHLFDNLLLHISALVFVALFSFLLFHDYCLGEF